MNDPSAMSTTCRRILLSVSFLIQAQLLAFAQPTINTTICIYNGNYTASNDNTYRANLNTALSTLSTNVDINGFYNASVGQNPNRVNAIILCRGDILLDECRSCLQTATDELLRVCPNQKQAVIYIGNCTLRYSNETLIGTVATEPKVAYNNFNDASNAGKFKESLAQLLDNLRVEAADGGPMRKVAAANATPTAPSFETIYSFVQCSPDLSKEDCSSCLVSAAREITLCCYNKVGAVILFPSCNLRYEIYPFYDEARLRELAPRRVAPAPSVVPAPPLLQSPPPAGKDDGNTNRIVIIIAVSAVAVLILAVLIGILLRKRMKRKPFEKLDTVDDISTVESLQYTFSTIQVATNDFSDSNKLGEGGFGAVYKGKLSNDREIAVKRLSKNSGQGDLEFKNEVLLLSRLQHRNLVRLLGFCIKGTEKLLVYEFVQNTSLDLFIFDQTNDKSYLDWERRYKIIGGIAKGILYLHEDSRLKIIHRDLKASNILLDGQLNPKIADFGMARLFGQDETQGSTSRIVGTHGYMAPEYVMYGQFSIKSDVFSFGVLVLEIISGQKNNCFQSGKNVVNLLSFAWRNWREGSVTSMVDPILIRSGSGSMNDILRCIHIGLLCVQANESDRPTMASVVLMLSSFSITLAVPSEPAFYMDRSGHDSEVVAGMQEFNSIDILANNNSSKSYNGGVQSDHSSNNNASFTITELDPR